MNTTRAQYKQDVKRVYYLSMEFLIGRTLSNALAALDLKDAAAAAVADDNDGPAAGFDGGPEKGGSGAWARGVRATALASTGANCAMKRSPYAATAAVFARRDVIVVASVSAIFGGDTQLF